jgi:hypothetical protein
MGLCSHIFKGGLCQVAGEIHRDSILQPATEQLSNRLTCDQTRVPVMPMVYGGTSMGSASCVMAEMQGLSKHAGASPEQNLGFSTLTARGSAVLPWD